MAETCPICGYPAEDTPNHRKSKHSYLSTLGSSITVNGIEYRIVLDTNNNPHLLKPDQSLPAELQPEAA